MYEQNRWAASRFGPHGKLIHPDRNVALSVAELANDLPVPLGRLDPTSCEADEQLAIGRAAGPAGSLRRARRALGTVSTMPVVTETIQVNGVRCERCVMRLAKMLEGHEGLEAANANLMGQVTMTWDDAADQQGSAARGNGPRRFSRARRRLGNACGETVVYAENTLVGWPAMSETTQEPDARKLAIEARDRVRFEEDALALSDQVYRVARHLVGSREEAEDLMQETYARAFRSWRSFTPGTNLRAWLLRILTNLNIDRGRKQQRTPDTQPLEEGDYFLYNKLEAAGDGATDEDRVVERLSQNDVVGALSEVPHDFRDVVVLVDIGDFTYADAAQILDIPIGTVMSRLHRGRRILKKAMAESAVGDEGA